jgi:hypothetical protein
MWKWRDGWDKTCHFLTSVRGLIKELQEDRWKFIRLRFRRPKKKTVPGGGRGSAKIALIPVKCKSLIANIKSKWRQRTFVNPINFFTFIYWRKFCDIQSYFHFILIKDIFFTVFGTFCVIPRYLHYLFFMTIKKINWADRRTCSCDSISHHVMYRYVQ